MELIKNLRGLLKIGTPGVQDLETLVLVIRDPHQPFRPGPFRAIYVYTLTLDGRQFPYIHG